MVGRGGGAGRGGALSSRRATIHRFPLPSAPPHTQHHGLLRRHGSQAPGQGEECESVGKGRGTAGDDQCGTVPHAPLENTRPNPHPLFLPSPIHFSSQYFGASRSCLTIFQSVQSLAVTTSQGVDAPLPPPPPPTRPPLPPPTSTTGASFVALATLRVPRSGREVAAAA